MRDLLARTAHPGARVAVFSLDRAAMLARCMRPDSTRAGRRSGSALAGNIWRYPVTSFLAWLNDITWTSEWDNVRDRGRPRRGSTSTCPVANSDYRLGHAQSRIARTLAR